ncbi:Fis family transcriptional regulator [Rhodococcus sp. MS16]|uniref:sigma-54-dependent Fis family transcriptional regulator n=1 Tax=unclassified Rhodococcus (in: high G+C Gram-positive bacteria) TaxID=192944 RepID=UPI00121248E4|nr:helix-turn-helix domain-containing protein [Rhodococcus sp. (in: high G+C Gram-positive bacteria)]NRI66454.1 Fis family transcriptional regulator [Rhodococcus sp. MS16]RZL21123.1 MAG: Fis family transcriptional regulator [Rhodococcus sp. (in: high G+C Gram-positive bacteria)]
MFDSSGTRDPVRPEIALSWKRSRLSGVDPSAAIAVDTADQDAESRLLRAATPVLDEVAQQLAGTGFCVLLADRECRVVASVYSDRLVERTIERLGVINGSRFGEEHAGTNALGTPLEVGRAVVIHGEEHFLDSLKGLSCYGQPILHPVTRRVEGILDMTGIVSQANPLFAPFLARAAADIEKRLLEGSKASEQRLVDAFQRVSHQRNIAVAAIGDDILLSNRTALDLLDTADHVSLRSLIADLNPDQSRLVTVELASGALARVQADRISGADGGALFLVEPLQRERAPIRRTHERTPSPGERLRRDLMRARASSSAVAISGEAGSGRTSAASDVVGSVDASWHDATRIAFDGREQWVTDLVRAARRRSGVVVIEQVQLLPDSVLPMIADLIDASAEGPRIVMTSGAVADLPPTIAALLSRCASRVVIAPLRERQAEIAELAQAMLEGISPELRLTASAAEALTAASWPGNLAELRVVLHRAAGDRVSNRIDVTDLPEDYRTTTKVSRLAGREKAERQAIIGALKDCGGNKVHASAQLGISRSTLYTRMRALDITV